MQAPLNTASCGISSGSSTFAKVPRMKGVNSSIRDQHFNIEFSTMSLYLNCFLTLRGYLFQKLLLIYILIRDYNMIVNS